MARPPTTIPARRHHGVASHRAGLGARGLAVVGLLMGLAACGAVGDAGTAQAAPAASAALPTPVAAGASTPDAGERLRAVRARLDAALSAASACTTDAQCRSVAIGAKACGGPGGYRAFATQPRDPRVVEELARQERDLSLAEARESGRASPCFVVTDPGARCVRDKCETGPGLEPPDSGTARR